MRQCQTGGSCNESAWLEFPSLHFIICYFYSFDWITFKNADYCQKEAATISLGPKKRFYFFLLSMRFVSLMEIITSNSIRVWEEEVETSKNCFIIIILFSFDSQIIFEFLSNDMQNTLFVPFQPTKNLGWERVELYQLKTICGCRFHSFKTLVKKFQTFILWRLE